MTMLFSCLDTAKLWNVICIGRTTLGTRDPSTSDVSKRRSVRRVYQTSAVRRQVEYVADMALQEFAERWHRHRDFSRLCRSRLRRGSPLEQRQQLCRRKQPYLVQLSSGWRMSDDDARRRAGDCGDSEPPEEVADARRSPPSGSRPNSLAAPQGNNRRANMAAVRPTLWKLRRECRRTC